MVAAMGVAIGAIGIGVALMIGYLVIAQIQSVAPTQGTMTNATYGNLTTSMDASRNVVFAGFALVAVLVIVIAAFGIVSVFK